MFAYRGEKWESESYNALSFKKFCIIKVLCFLKDCMGFNKIWPCHDSEL